MAILRPVLSTKKWLIKSLVILSMIISKCLYVIKIYLLFEFSRMYFYVACAYTVILKGERRILDQQFFKHPLASYRKLKIANK